MSEELGKKYPCFGEFKCPRCHKKWQSSKAWADYGQQCKSCSINVMASQLQKLFVYICSNCKEKWSSNYQAQGQKCKRCSSSKLVRPLDREKYQDRQFIKAHKLQEFDDVGDENHIDPNKEHRQDLCEKCQKLGRPCRQTAGQNYAPMDNENIFGVSQKSIFYLKILFYQHFFSIQGKR
jgi:DNA-directed RNA polymerase subunit RPC12/RpoP